jgi:hypothetical protein
MIRTSRQTRKQANRKLLLQREVIATLSDAALTDVVGGENPNCDSERRSGCSGLVVDDNTGLLK